MQPLLGPDGDAALASLLQRAPLLAFDFDGTLAPIVDDPADARTDPALVPRLARLATLLPVAVVSGRRLADLQPRLGFAPRFLVGNHGAEDEGDPAAAQHFAAALDRARALLHAQTAALAAAGVSVEDKGASIALHFRRAADEARARAAIAAALPDDRARWLAFGGKKVVNLVAAGAPDKAASVRALVARSGAGAALFVGDDVNDEPVFAAAPAHWLTVRVGRDGAPTQARWSLEGTAQVGPLLDRLIALCPPAPPDAGTAAFPVARR